MSRVTTHLGFVEPQRLTLTDRPPQGSDWFHEVKHDGYRTLVERRAKLKKLLRADQTSPLQFSNEFTGDSAAFFQACAATRS